MTSPDSFIQETLNAHPVVVFSKSWCGYCTRVKGLFTKIGVTYHDVDLEKVSNGSGIQQTLKKMTGQSTVPSVWIGKKFVGGCDDTHRLHSNGKLKELLQNAQVSSNL
uniref:Glutaredoxin domain-containing protein n=1 Tax=Arcella intermedia TaxID=1963864 RepID=A0A6B2LSU0_9EUKA|eukprot:TRINITY_DN5101_c0_g1_i1.p1 TRINITY_DN5101_c0_g1~~TRINITY_DN5101_c0_g1_i1.p1  ORF type:complete len:108 (-),score=9.34 TRINITY_DN5101_c0_g1_i1:133-456(-)